YISKDSPGFGHLCVETYNAPVPEYFCYIIECADGSFYTGWSTNPVRRLKEHSAGRGARYTRVRRPLRLVYTERQPDRSAAQRRELKIKRLSHTRKEALIITSAMEEAPIK
ncbi:MAG: GIY-YIG nuclease family protein, partial [Anaerolineales bacterium]|nr:GIY-YIG nuclease family protein [Anaerolineales bacterium]